MSPNQDKQGAIQILAALFLIHRAPYLEVGTPVVTAQLASFSNKHFGYAQIPMNGSCT